MKNRTQKAAQDYQKKNWKGTEAAFYPTDATDIIKNSGGVLDAVITALEAGFMIGYRKAQRDYRKRQKTT